MKKKNGFTLVELLAVIVILAIILVIAVPSIMNTIEDSRKGALESSTKMIASAAETQKMTKETLGQEFTGGDCMASTATWSGIVGDSHYASCSVSFSGDVATVELKGAASYADYTCTGTRTSVNCTENS